MRRFVAVLALVGCRAPAPIVALTDAGDACPAGGVRVAVGVDEDGDGALSAAEEDRAEVVCSGADGLTGVKGDAGSVGTDALAPLVATTTLPRGDEDCPFGGVRFEAGRDDGLPSGVAGDRILQPGEVDATAVVCDGISVVDTPDLVGPSGPVGAGILDVSGGAGTSCAGGAGGRVEIGGQTPGVVALWDRGTVDATTTIPTPVGPSGLGAVPLVVAADTIAETRADANCDGVVDNLSGLSDGDVVIGCGRLLLVGAGTSRRVTGAHVLPGRTLTLQAPGAFDAPIAVSFPGDVWNEGTIVVYSTTAELHPNRYVGAATGTLWLPPGEHVVGAATFHDRGRVEARGAVLRVEADTVVAGDVDVSGGGDPAGTLEVVARRLVVTGDVDARGASTGEGGGPGGFVHLQADAELVVTGTVDVSGGAPTLACAASCAGGAAGAVFFGVLEGARFAFTGAIRADGGAGTTGPGGSGGVLSVSASADTSGAVGSLPLGGAWSARGGGGQSGGAGGVIQVHNAPVAGLDPSIAFVGLSGVFADGGAAAGACAGGDGGEVFVWNQCPPSGSPSPAGPAVVRAPVRARGGAGGGHGGAIEVRACEAATMEASRALAVLRGDADVSGAGPGAHGGTVVADGHDGAAVSGEVRAVGGATGFGGVLVLTSDGPVTFEGTLLGGPDGGLYAGGRTVDVVATIALRTDPTGGAVVLDSRRPPSILLGTVDAASIVIDGHDRSGDF